MKSIKIVILGLFVSLGSGCASYRTNSDISFESTSGTETATKVEILESGLEKGGYEVIGPVEAVVKKLTVFHKDPTKEQVNVVLAEKASKLNADAVINVKYKSGVGMTTWGYMEGKGEAVKKVAVEE